MASDPRSAGKARRLLWLLMISVVAALSVVAAGCGGDDDDEGTDGTETSATGGDCEQSIWVLLPDSTTSPRWETDDRRYFGEAFTEAGVEHTIVNAENSAETQQSQAEQAIADDAAVIILTSVDSGSGATIVDLAKEAGVEVIEYDRFNTGGSGGAAYVSFDNEEVGRTMATALEPEIDALDVDTPAVVMLNGGEEDNNSFQFRAGYAETVEAKVDAGDWTLAADQHVPGWGANGEGQGIMEQVLTDANNEINGVFAANDNLAQQAINALEAAGVGPIPVSGQDASAAGMQNVALGNQTMSVYKPFPDEAGVAAEVALALCTGEDFQQAATDYQSDLASGGSGATIIGVDTETGEATASADEEGSIPFIALEPIAITVDNIVDTVIADNFRTIEEICTGDVAQTDFCQENS
jgi:D-xylose transport system substrate-binding protein